MSHGGIGCKVGPGKVGVSEKRKKDERVRVCRNGSCRPVSFWWLWVVVWFVVV